MKDNLEETRNSLTDWEERFATASGEGRKLAAATWDMGSFDLMVFGCQRGVRYNGHFRRYVYHPMVASLAAMLAHNLWGTARGLLENETGSGWDAGRMGETLLKTGARIVKHSRSLFLAIAEAAVPIWNLFRHAGALSRSAPESTAQAPLGSASRPRGPLSGPSVMTFSRFRISASREIRFEEDTPRTKNNLMEFHPPRSGTKGELCPDLAPNASFETIIVGVRHIYSNFN
ncbi:MAG: hypothetical protein KC964_28735 [Candidatus Omnitrophica bacterium]|nr:hypothetical protein [Candidatus Omnitrophota bacterium]